MLLQHYRDRLVLVQRCTASASAFRVGGQRLSQVLGQSQVIDNQAAGLVLEHSVHAGNGLHQAVPAHRLVNVHGVEARRVEARQPHVPHQHDFQRVARVTRNRWANPSRRALFLMWGCQSKGSEAEPVITTLMLPLASSSSSQSGRRRTSSR